MKKNHTRPVSYPNAAVPAHFVQKLFLGLQSVLVGVGLSFTVMLLLFL